jgi:hypothetical protein
VLRQPPAARRAARLRRIVPLETGGPIGRQSQNSRLAQVNRKALAPNLGSTARVEPARHSPRGGVGVGDQGRKFWKIWPAHRRAAARTSREPWSNSIAANSGKCRPIVPAKN